MSNIVIRLYDWLRRHRGLRWLSLTAITLLLVWLVSGLRYEEDITAFMPLDASERTALDVYQHTAGADRIIVSIGSRDSSEVEADTLVAAIDQMKTLWEADSALSVHGTMTTDIDMDAMSEVSEYVYEHIPYFLRESDLQRMDSLLSQPDYIDRRIEADKQMLLLPLSGQWSGSIQYDPLGLFTPIVEQMPHRGSHPQYELYDGHIFTPDMSRAISLLSTPYGSSETDRNTVLVSSLQQMADSVETHHPSVRVHLTGAPVVAVGNARQIKTDSVWAVGIAIVLIVLLLWLSFRSVANILLIVLSIGWGGLVALAGMALLHDEVSVIVIGISSVIIGIAVNYPLHLTAHLNHTPDVRSALREIVAPLVVGNVTTVGAFLALVPLRSTALRDLGLFSALLLVGTIIFVLLYLPHLVRVHQKSRVSAMHRLGDMSIDNKPWIVGVVCLLTVVLAYYSTQTTFDSDMQSINYMTDEQREDLDYLQRTMQGRDSGLHSVYVLSSGDTAEEALVRQGKYQDALHELQARGLVQSVQTAVPFVSDSSEQRQRLERWERWTAEHGATLKQQIKASAAQHGFAPDTFEPFLTLTDKHFEPIDMSELSPLTTTLLSSNLYADSLHGKYHVVDQLMCTADNESAVLAALSHHPSGIYAFDIRALNSSVASSMSEDFNYIGWACSAIVFLFLWLSLGSIELALLSFLPMAVSWLWILGLMSLFDIHFNVVNVILATFIFGQGDDYTIFMTEGCQWEYAYRRRMLSSYKNSIILSALIMFIGIGALITARHPALRSLALVTIVGMSSVVLMAYLFPPLIFRWLVRSRGSERYRPLTLRGIVLRLTGRGDESHRRENEGEAYYRQLVLDRYRYRGAEISRAVRKSLRHAAGSAESDDSTERTVVIENSGWGSETLLMALQHPTWHIHAIERDDEKRSVAIHAAEGVAPQLHYHASAEEANIQTNEIS